MILGRLSPRGSSDGLVAGPAAEDPSVYRLVSPEQVHGLRVVGVSEYASDSAQMTDPGRLGAPCDGLTLHPELDRGLAPLLLFADCVPIVLVGEVDMAVVHGGWRGILGGIVHAGARAMTGPPGSAVIGPSIGPCCFTVDEEVARAFSRRFGAEVAKSSDDGAKVDLWAAAEVALAESGVGPRSGREPPAMHSLQPRPVLLISGRRPRDGSAGLCRLDGPGMNVAGPERVRSNVEEVQRKIGAALERSGRKTRPRLLVASKYLTVEQMALLDWAGIRLVGENRAEGLEEKWRRWNGHFRVPLHRPPTDRKVRQVLPFVSLIHSVESMSSRGGAEQESRAAGKGPDGGQRERRGKQVWYPPGGRGDLPGASRGL